MVRRARDRGTWLAARIAQRAHDVFLEPRRQLVGPDGRTGLLAPRSVGQGGIPQGLGSGPGQRADSPGAHRAGEDGPTPRQRATIQQAVAANGLRSRGPGPAAAKIGNAHLSSLAAPSVGVCCCPKRIYFLATGQSPGWQGTNMRLSRRDRQRSSSPRKSRKMRRCRLETRAGKILPGTMRRIADGEDYSMPATIDDPAVLGEINAVLADAGYGRRDRV